ncbi:MAG TPA: hypothetical protein VNI54_02930 [Thermoanaerobaculia bacterium]|nr:hypothetical protein [Thermoanaerobaculia bacterium]
MTGKRIFAVGFDLPGDEFEYIPLESDRTLLDADIVLYKPRFGQWEQAWQSFDGLQDYQGVAVMNDISSREVPKRLAHWRTEMVAAVNAGKLVVFYLNKPEVLFRYTGERQFSGTGRNQKTTNIVSEISTYQAMPAKVAASARTGTAVKAAKDNAIIASYWKDFAAMSSYEATIEGEFGKTLLETPGVSRTIAAIFHATSGGAILFLPPITYDPKKFLKTDKDNLDKQFWTAEALKFGKRYSAALVAIAKTLAVRTNVTPTPSWATDTTYSTKGEAKIHAELAGLKKKATSLEEKRKRLEGDLQAAGVLRWLLYEQGKPLERAVLESLSLMGFATETVNDGDSEFDAVFTSTEGRCLGEAEGKDNKPVNIDKLSQLERNISEDFARDQVTEHAKGVLFGNAYRLTPPTERGDYFTEKCLSGAKRAKIALVRTPDLFPVGRYLKESSDSEFAAQCRAAIFSAEGEVVQFPPIPESGEDAE